MNNAILGGLVVYALMVTALCTALYFGALNNLNNMSFELCPVAAQALEDGTVTRKLTGESNAD